MQCKACLLLAGPGYLVVGALQIDSTEDMIGYMCNLIYLVIYRFKERTFHD